MQKISCARTFWNLLLADLLIFKQIFWDKLINLLIWVFCILVVMGYIMPSFGLSSNYGSFILAGMLASAGFFEVYPSVVGLISDFEGDQVISYYLTLPIKPSLILVKSMSYFAISAATMSLFILPFGKIILWNNFSLSQISIPRLILIFVLFNVFYGTLTLWVACKIENMTKLGNVWMRFIFPMWFFGGFQFSWQVLYKISPTLAYVNLINPMTYIMEGTRAAVLGQEGNLPFWFCATMIAIISILCGLHAIVRLKKRLDFV